MQSFNDDGGLEGIVVFLSEAGVGRRLGRSEDFDAESLVFAQRPLGISHHHSRVGQRNDLVHHKLQTWMAIGADIFKRKRDNTACTERFNKFDATGSANW